ncbi:DUF262 domain-containing protein [Clostridium aminobutyricum]|uniref:DUF262 domain-containing protein n=1 Tax=Clostridium aminobutyricum TaxID=33953 RepID=A0A939DBD6_CLOAM|nr:DUF262 domain-containing protein [Clostridium aminobutyricum]MBN7774153.1 DUF262 domain-containing protein [Clostridium aminobutyricum]
MDTWYDLENFDDEEAIAINEYDITVSPNDFNISTLFSLMDNGVIKLPAFQRNYVWDIKAASKLIESIILGLPIPQVFLYEKGKNNFLIIDGQQRLLSIYFFMKERFPNAEGRKLLRNYLTGDEVIDKAFLSDDRYFSNFSLKLPAPIATEKNKLDGLKFETLSDNKHSFEFLRTIRSVVIKQNEPEDADSSMYEIFNRLNTGGQKLKPQEIRMSLYYSNFYKMLFEVNLEKRWRELIGQQSIDLNFKDIEILIRAYAMLFDHTEYKATMTKFLNRFSKISGGFDDELNKYLRRLFMSFLESTENLSSRDFFSSNGKFNISLFESVFVATCSSFFKSKDILTGKITKESVLALKSDDDFREASQSSVGSKANVTTRMSRAIDLIIVE